MCNFKCLNCSPPSSRSLDFYGLKIEVSFYTQVQRKKIFIPELKANTARKAWCLAKACETWSG